MTAQTTLTRSSYGELLTGYDTNPEHRALIAQTHDLIKMAGKKIPAAYDDMTWERINSRIGNKRVGEARHHEIYDINPAGTKVLICCREVEGSKYGIKTVSKTYYLIARHGKGVKVSEAAKAVAAKAAKAAGPVIGYAIEVIEGKTRLKVKALETRQGYKAMTLDESGNPVSVWDGSPWPIGKTRTEKATDDHTGGFYYYATLDEVLAAAHQNNIFGDAREHHDLVIARVEVSGREALISASGKRCATRIKPVEIVASVTI
jgi:hypothetical protein